MYHNFLIHSSADGHLGCFHVLAIVKGAATNIGLHVCLSLLASLMCMPSRIFFPCSWQGVVHGWTSIFQVTLASWEASIFHPVFLNYRTMAISHFDLDFAII